MPSPTDLKTAEDIQRLQELRRSRKLSGAEAAELERLRHTVNQELLGGPIASQMEQLTALLEQSKIASPGTTERQDSTYTSENKAARENLPHFKRTENFQIMHWVDRGPEPQELKAIRSRYTARWVKYYGDGDGSKPGDFLWRRFHVQLRGVFLGLCAYCEECCRGEVEHFRRKSRFPKLVYQWSNWLFVCHDCNHMKGEKWPQGGYVNPCARSQSAWPETFFDFDTLTGEILQRRASDHPAGKRQCR